MSSLLYFAINNNLTSDEIDKIDQEVIQNKEEVYFVIENMCLASNRKTRRLRQKLKTVRTKVKTKVKRFGARVIFVYTLSNPFAQIVLPFPQTFQQIERVREYKQEQFFESLEVEAVNLPERKPDKITLIKLSKEELKQIENLVFQVRTGSLTVDEAILKLKGGFDVTGFALVVFIIYLFYRIDTLTHGYAPAPPPKSTGFRDSLNWMHNHVKDIFKRDGLPSSQPISRFDREVVGPATRMCMATPDQDGYVMSYEEAVKLLTETYPGSEQITTNYRMTNRQAASHLYHATSFGIDPTEYGITQEELMKIAKEGGLREYAQRGNPLPSPELVKAYQQAVKHVCQDPETEMKEGIQFFDKNGIKDVTTFQNDRIIIIFHQSTDDSATDQNFITGNKRRARFFKDFNKTGQIGSKQWIRKWSKNNNNNNN